MIPPLRSDISALINDIAFRPAGRAEIAAIEEMMSQSFASTALPHYAPHELEVALAVIPRLDPSLVAGGTLFVAEANGALLGCAGWQPAFAGTSGLWRKTPYATGTESEGLAEIRSVFVAAPWLGQGLGTRLLNHVESAALADGHKGLVLVATLQGVAAYKRRGYAAIGPALLQGGSIPLGAVAMRKQPA